MILAPASQPGLGFARVGAMMDVLYGLAKSLGLLATPSQGLIAALIFSLIWLISGLWRRWAIVAVSASGAGLALAGFAPISDGLLRPLEKRFPPLALCANGTMPAGVIILGGGMKSVVVGGAALDQLGEAGERVRLGAFLASLYPGAPIVLTGGHAFAPRLGKGGVRPDAEAIVMRRYLVEAGVQTERILVEDQSRTTLENAAFVRALAQTRPGPWILVTSAFHMPRAVALFEAAGVKVKAAPTDWRVEDISAGFRAPPSTYLQQTDAAVREYLGLLAYRAAGRTHSVMPSANSQAQCMAYGSP